MRGILRIFGLSVEEFEFEEFEPEADEGIPIVDQEEDSTDVGDYDQAWAEVAVDGHRLYYVP